MGGCVNFIDIVMVNLFDTLKMIDNIIKTDALLGAKEYFK